MAASARATQSSKPPRTGSWQQDGDSSVLQFTALPMRMHTLALVITLMVLPIGAATAAMLISLDMMNFRFPVRVTIVVVGLGLAVPVCLIFFRTIRALATEYTVRLTPSRIDISSAREQQSFALQDIRLLRWRSQTDYARLVLVTGTRKISLLAGLRRARLRSDRSIVLPPIPEGYQQHLASLGFSMRRTWRAPDLVSFRRADGAQP
ncbi:hypothetical protein [Arthrobacter russicus]|jgi:hypothetical protein|uniref:Uncharacterized protein n=1 Tax=Arthrobacter russicus TaxID=172040 RepID=A0ABU1J6S1_9MICC|nr:hypothetical protein [Arthrobacter russicus]MDN5668028.1 hypothetical protein [Renibacterium salmoninarum]MDR6268095.1 hypothetical protein [Arthrobacter russicus]